MKKLAFLIFICTFILLRPYLIQSGSFWYNGDDQDYFAQASSIVFGEFPSYKNEYFINLKEGPMGSIGCGILAAPFVLIFSTIDRIAGSSIVEKRTAENIPGSWSQFGFLFASTFYFSLSCLLLFRAVSFFTPSSYALYAVILMILCQGMPLFAYRRPIFSHMSELFLQSTFIYLFLKNELSGRNFLKQWWSFIVLGICAALLFLTRNNNILFALSWPLFFLRGTPERNKLNTLIPRLFYIFFPFALCILIFKIWPESYNHYIPYANAMNFVKVTASFQEILSRIIHVFIGLDWGLIFTAPFLLLGITSLFIIKAPWKKRLILASLPLLINFYIVIFFGSQGGWYGYRYLIASAFPLFVLPLAMMLNQITTTKIKKLLFLLGVIAIPPLLSMVCFESNNSNLDLQLVNVAFGKTDYTNYLYQLHTWETFLFKPLQILHCLYIGGSQYVQHLFINFFQNFGLFSNSYSRKYSEFDITTLIKVILLYSIPFAMAWFFRKPNKKSC